MPHLHIEAFKVPASLPVTQNGVHIAYVAHNALFENEKLIAVECEGKRFFLLLKVQPDKMLLKYDKISRPAATHLLKRALNAYREAADLTVISSNVDDHTPSRHLEDDAALRTIRDFAEAFPTDREVRIEVGFGSGRHLLHQAAAHPECLFIGIEIHKPSIEQVLKQINIQKLSNVLLLDYDARLFLELVPSNVVGRIYVHFPVPWDKKPHRRVIGEAFIGESIRALAPGGRLELRTDSDNYFNYAFATFMALRQNHIEIHKNREIAVSSKYEDRWRRMEKNIYDIVMHNDETSGPLTIDGAFDFPETPVDAARLSMLNDSTHRFHEGFIHFERLYRTDDGRHLLRLSIGPYERPEHLYVLLDATPHYFPEPPVRSRINLKAHAQILELLYG